MQFLIDNAIWITLTVSLFGLVFVWLQRKWIIPHETGTDYMRQIAAAIWQGAMAYLRRQFRYSVALVVVIVIELVSLAVIGLGVVLKLHLGVVIATLSGLAAGLAFGLITEYFTSDAYQPTRGRAASAQSGSAVVIIHGLSIGMRSTLLPVLVIVIATITAFKSAGHYGEKGSGPHKASVIVDTLGDPFKDTAGPSLGTLIELVVKASDDRA